MTPEQWLTGRTPSEQDSDCTVTGACDIVPLPRRIEALAMRNKLFCGDNLDVLRHCIADDSIDLVYLDPPFNSNQNYNLLFREKDGSKSASQILAFEDTWEWNLEARRNYDSVVQKAGALAQVMGQFRTMLGDTDMLAYLSMMAPRLVELHRVLKPTGSIYLHCDPTASHYLKTLMDSIFGPLSFRNEIIWKRTSGHSDAERYGCVHDVILFFSRSDKYLWNRTCQPYERGYVEQYYRYKDADGRLWMSGDLGASGLQGGGYKYSWKGITRVWRVPEKSNSWHSIDV